MDDYRCYISGQTKYYKDDEFEGTEESRIAACLATPHPERRVYIMIGDQTYKYYPAMLSGEERLQLEDLLLDYRHETDPEPKEMLERYLQLLLQKYQGRNP